MGVRYACAQAHSAAQEGRAHAAANCTGKYACVGVRYACAQTHSAAEEGRAHAAADCTGKCACVGVRYACAQAHSAAQEGRAHAAADCTGECACVGVRCACGPPGRLPTGVRALACFMKVCVRACVSADLPQRCSNIPSGSCLPVLICSFLIVDFTCETVSDCCVSDRKTGTSL